MRNVRRIRRVGREKICLTCAEIHCTSKAGESNCPTCVEMHHTSRAGMGKICPTFVEFVITQAEGDGGKFILLVLNLSSHKQSGEN